MKSRAERSGGERSGVKWNEKQSGVEWRGERGEEKSEVKKKEEQSGEE